jgi:hypothetical protein
MNLFKKKIKPNLIDIKMWFINLIQIKYESLYVILNKLIL